MREFNAQSFICRDHRRHLQQDFFRDLSRLTFVAIERLRETRSMFIRIRALYLSDLAHRDCIEVYLLARVYLVNICLGDAFGFVADVSFTRDPTGLRSPSNPRSAIRERL